MLKVGVTGGIGSGKTTVCNILENLGVPIFNSDLEGRKILNTNEVVKKEVKEAFEDEMYDSKGELDRERMANLVFNDPQAMSKITRIVHPRVQEAFEEFCQLHEKSPYVIKEAAILLESGTYHDLDKIVNVFAPKEDRIQRVMKRDGVSEENVRKRMNFQYSDEERNDLSDVIVMNEEGEDLLPQIMELHEIFLNEKK